MNTLGYSISFQPIRVICVIRGDLPDGKPRMEEVRNHQPIRRALRDARHNFSSQFDLVAAKAALSLYVVQLVSLSLIPSYTPNGV